MKFAAITWRALRSTFAMIAIIGLGVGTYYLWAPLFYVYLAIWALNLLNLFWRIGIGSLTRGWPTVKAEFNAAMQELLAEEEADMAKARERIQANQAKLRGEEPPAEADDSRPRLRVINGGNGNDAS